MEKGGGRGGGVERENKEKEKEKENGNEQQQDQDGGGDGSNSPPPSWTGAGGPKLSSRKHPFRLMCFLLPLSVPLSPIAFLFIDRLMSC